MPNQATATATTPSATADAASKDTTKEAAPTSQQATQPTPEAYTAADALRETDDAATKAAAEGKTEDKSKADADKTKTKADQTGDEKPPGEDKDSEPTFSDDGAPAPKEAAKAAEGEPTRYKLDETVEKALTEHAPEALTRLKQHIQGLEKREEQVAAQASKYTAFDAADEAINDPKRVSLAVGQFLTLAAARHGVEIDELLDSLTDEVLEEAAKIVSGPTAQRRQGEASPTLRTQPDPQVAMLLKRIDDLEGQVKGVLGDKEAAEQKKAEEAHLDRVAPETIGYLKKIIPGFEVTRDMVGEAIKRFPDLRNKPASAVRMLYGEKIGEHIAKLRANREIPSEMIDAGGAARGQAPKSPEDYKAADAIADLQLS